MAKASTSAAAPDEAPPLPPPLPPVLLPTTLAIPHNAIDNSCGMKPLRSAGSSMAYRAASTQKGVAMFAWSRSLATAQRLFAKPCGVVSKNLFWRSWLTQLLQKSPSGAPLTSNLAMAQRLFARHCALKEETRGVPSRTIAETNFNSLAFPPALLARRAKPHSELESSMEVNCGRSGGTFSEMAAMMASTSLPPALTLPKAHKMRITCRGVLISWLQAHSWARMISKRWSRLIAVGEEFCPSASENFATMCKHETNSPTDRCSS
mmetsp:Transcript_18878/g.52662  ORF Transcript_18878/g.52662 Transcript_18878/m.52662 type:complete len:264 (+) Transcript_18878:177-968(+)